MKCRKMKIWKDEQGKEHRDIVWFGSYGVKKLNGYISLSTIVDYLVSLGYDEDVLGYGIDKDNCNYIDFENKKVVIKYARVDLGELSWYYSSGGYTRFYSNALNDVKKPSSDSVKANFICSKYASGTASGVYNGTAEIAIGSGGAIWILGTLFDTTDATIVKQRLSGVPLVYELAEPIEIDISSILTTDEINALSRKLYFKNEYDAEMPSSVTYTLNDGTTQTNTDVAYMKSLPTNAVDKVKVNSVGGITYKQINLFDKSTAIIGYIDDVNGALNLNTNYKSSDYISVLPNTEYYRLMPSNIQKWGAFYDVNKNYISGFSNQVLLTSPSNAAYMRMTVSSPDHQDINSICINVSNPEYNGNYYPYFEGLRYVYASSISNNQTKDVDYNQALRANDDYSTKFVAHDNYATEQEGVVNSLIQRLSVIQGELWWQMDYGIPLFSNITSKAIMDSSVVDITLEHEDVLEFINFSSTLEQHNYKCNFEVLTTYGNIIVNI